MKQEHQQFNMKHKTLTIFKFRRLGFHRNETSCNNEVNLQIENANIQKTLNLKFQIWNLDRDESLKMNRFSGEGLHFARRRRLRCCGGARVRRRRRWLRWCYGSPEKEIVAVVLGFAGEGDGCIKLICISIKNECVRKKKKRMNAYF
jgi:hypothetical protein